MGGVEDRVREFLESWDKTHCYICLDPIQDGKFIMIGGKIYCLVCHELELNKRNKLDKLNEHTK